MTYTTLSDKLERLDKRIEELASKNEYKESVKKGVQGALTGIGDVDAGRRLEQNYPEPFCG